MSDENTPDVKLSKKSWISVESMITVLIMAVAITGTWFRIEVKSDQNKKDIIEINEKLGSYVEQTTAELTKINATLTEMLIETRIKNELASVQMRDRWTSEMMEDYSVAWLSLLQGYHPEMKHSDIPSVKETQRLNGFSND